MDISNDLKKKYFVKKILAWGKKNIRKFPWRKHGITFYESLIAELLLTKTSSKQVESIYDDLIRKYPTPQAILAALDNDVLEIIKPLGLYNQRIKALKNTCQILIEKGLPISPNDFYELPFVGSYIYNAISCFCFNKRIPIIDTNVIRIYSRYFDLEKTKDARRNKEVSQIAEQLIPPRKYVLYNYTLLDFGSLVCTGKGKPKCAACPVSASCSYSQVFIIINKIDKIH